MSVGAVNKQTGERIPTAGIPAVDSVLSSVSTNPVQNRVVKAALDDKQDAYDTITYAEWQAMTPEQQAAKDYYISDYPSSVLTAGNIAYDNTSSGMTANKVQGAIDELKSGLTNYELQNNINLEVPNRKNLAGNPYGVMLNSSGVFVSANVRSYIIPTNLGTITISVDDITKISDDVIRIGYCDDIPAESGTGVRVSSMTTNTYTITPNTGYKYIVVSNLLDNDYGWQDIQIELGSTATAYTPYIPSVESRLTNLANPLGTYNVMGIFQTSQLYNNSYGIAVVTGFDPSIHTATINSASTLDGTELTLTYNTHSTKKGVIGFFVADSTVLGKIVNINITVS